jgi:hypothetical protein
MKIAAIVLIILGAIGLAYGGFKVAYPDKIIDAGPIQVTVTKQRTLPIPPILGAVALAGGVILFIVGSRRGGDAAG